MHMIFSSLEPADVARLRTMDHALAEIGIEYLVPSVWIELKMTSVARFLAIAHHPVISKYVRHIYYAYDLLSGLSRLQWERAIESPAYIALEKAKATGDTNARYNESISKWLRFVGRKMNQGRRNCCSYGDLDRAFLIFKRYCAEQEHLREIGFLSGDLTEGLSRLPNIQLIQLVGHGTFDEYQYEIQAFLDASCNKSQLSYPSTEAARSMFLAFCRAASKTSSRLASESPDQDRGKIFEQKQMCLSLDRMPWALLKMGTEDFSLMQAGLRHVDMLDLNFTYNCRGIYQRLKEGDLHTFVKAATNLEKLCLLHRQCPECNILDLTDIVGTYQWVALSTILLSCVSITQTGFLQFCRRHQKTLSSVMLRHAWLDLRDEKTGSWCSIFSQMRNILDLKSARMRGIFSELSQGKFKQVRMEITAPRSDLPIWQHIGLYLRKKQNPEVNFFVNTTTGKGEWHYDSDGETHREMWEWDV